MHRHGPVQEIPNPTRLKPQPFLSLAYAGPGEEEVCHLENLEVYQTQQRNQ